MYFTIKQNKSGLLSTDGLTHLFGDTVWFYIDCLYLYFRYIIRGVLTGLTLPHFCACPKPGPEISLLFVVTCDIFCVHLFDMRGSCLFY